MSEATPDQAPEAPETPEKNPMLEKLMREKENWRSQALENQKKIQEAEKQKMEEQQKFKELADMWKTKAETYELQVKEQKEREVKATKLNALKSELSKMGIKSDKVELAFKLAPIDSLKYDEDNRIVFGADAVAKQLKEQTPEWFSGTNTSGVNHSAPASNPASITPEAWSKMSPEDRRKMDLKDVYKAFGIDAR